MSAANNKALGTWFSLAAGALGLAALVLYLVWAPGHNALDPVIPWTLAAGILLEGILYFRDISFLGVAATACFSTAFFILLSRSVGTFVDAMQGIVMFGDASQLGIILTLCALMFLSILLSILSCFVKRRK